MLHNVHVDGRVMHLFTKVDGVWTCACGETRDRYGQELTHHAEPAEAQARG